MFANTTVFVIARSKKKEEGLERDRYNLTRRMFAQSGAENMAFSPQREQRSIVSKLNRTIDFAR